MPKGHCKDCRHSEPAPPHVGENMFRCHLDPPRNGVWPQVGADDWCGQFDGRPVSSPAKVDATVTVNVDQNGKGSAPIARGKKVTR